MCMVVCFLAAVAHNMLLIATSTVVVVMVVDRWKEIQWHALRQVTN